MKTQDLIAANRTLAHRLHGDQKYGERPYSEHLDDVRRVLTRFGFTSELFPVLHMAADQHDVYEDHRKTAKPEMFLALGVPQRAIDIAMALRDGEGVNRRERQQSSYKKIAQDPDAVILKLADRIANIEASIAENSKLQFMYAKEHRHFRDALENANPAAAALWEHLNTLVESIPSKGGKGDTPLVMPGIASPGGGVVGTNVCDRRHL